MRDDDECSSRSPWQALEDRFDGVEASRRTADDDYARGRPCASGAGLGRCAFPPRRRLQWIDAMVSIAIIPTAERERTKYGSSYGATRRRNSPSRLRISGRRRAFSEAFD
jgi:hypothetical protein